MSERARELVRLVLDAEAPVVRKWLAELAPAERTALDRAIGKTLTGMLRVIPLSLQGHRFDAEPSLAALLADPTTWQPRPGPFLEPDRVLDSVACAIAATVPESRMRKALRAVAGACADMRVVGGAVLDRGEPWCVDALVVEARAQAADHAYALVPLLRGRSPELDRILMPLVGDMIAETAFGDEVRIDSLIEHPSADLLAALARDGDRSMGFLPIERAEVVAAILALVDRGHIERRALVELTIEKLSARLRPSLANGWARLASKLALAPAELREHRSRVLRFVRARNATVAGLGIEEARRMLDEDPSRTERVIELAVEAAQHPAAEARVAAIDLLDRVRDARPDLSPAVLRALIDTLTSTSARVRARALRAIGRASSGSFSGELSDRLASAASQLPASERTLLEGVRALDPSRPRATDVAAPASEPARLSIAILPGAEDVERRIPSAAGEIDGPPFERLGSAEAVARLLLTTASSSLDARQMEQLLDGLAQFGDELRTPELVRLLDPCLVERGPSYGMGAYLAQLWLGRGRPDSAWFYPGDSRMARLEAIERASAKGETVTLLARPTHRLGWLDPRALVERVSAARSIDSFDLAAALFRLVPNDAARAEARASFSRHRLAPENEWARQSIETALADEAPSSLAADSLPTDPRGMRVLLAALRGRLGVESLEQHTGAAWADAVEHELAPRNVPVDMQWDRFATAARGDRTSLLTYFWRRRWFGAGAFDTESHRLMAVFAFPAAAGDLFLIGTDWLRLMTERTAMHVAAHAFELALVEAGAYRWVDVHADVTTVVCMLGSRDRRHRERCLALLLGWIDDGRVTPLATARAIAARVADGRVSPKYADEAIGAVEGLRPWGPAFGKLAAVEMLRGGSAVPTRALRLAVGRLERLALQPAATLHKDVRDLLAPLARGDARSSVQTILERAAFDDNPEWTKVAASIAR